MNEEAIEQAFADDEVEQQAEDNNEIESNQETEQEEIQLTALEQEARDGGHTSKDEWIDAGKDPERWKSPHEFVSYGKMHKALDDTKAKMDQMDNDFNARIKSLNNLHKADTESKIQALKDLQREAVGDGDTEAYDKSQRQIDDLEKSEPETTTTTQPTKDPAVQEWEAKNDWINNASDPRAQMAMGLWNGFANSNPNATAQQALDYVDKQMNISSDPTPNPRRNSPNTNERSVPTSKKSSRDLTMADITPEEKSLWVNADYWGGDETKFLKSVKDSRKK